MAVAAEVVSFEPVKLKAGDSPDAAESAESTDMSSSEDANLGDSKSQTGCPSPSPSPRRRLVQWSDLLDSRMLASEEMDDSEGPDQHDDDIANLAAPRSACEFAGSEKLDLDEQNLTSAQSKRRSRRRRRHLKATTSDASTAASRSPSNLSTTSERDDCVDYFYPQHNVPSKFTGLSTHCHTGPAPVARGGRNVVTWNDILGQDLSLGPKASPPPVSYPVTAPQSSSSMPTGTVKMACPQSSPSTMMEPTFGYGMEPAWMEQSWSCMDSSAFGAWMEPCHKAVELGTCEAGARTPWSEPQVTPWNPPYWESPVNTLGHGQADPSLSTWLEANGLPSCKSAIAEQLMAYIPETYED